MICWDLTICFIPLSLCQALSWHGYTHCSHALWIWLFGSYHWWAGNEQAGCVKCTGFWCPLLSRFIPASIVQMLKLRTQSWPEKSGVGQNIVMHSLLTARNFFCVLISTFPVHSPSFFSDPLPKSNCTCLDCCVLFRFFVVETNDLMSFCLPWYIWFKVQLKIVGRSLWKLASCL